MAAAIDRGNHSKSFENAVAVTPSDGADLGFVTRGVVVGVTGNVAVNTIGPDGTNPTTIPMVAGVIYWLRASRILATNTTATGIVALW